MQAWGYSCDAGTLSETRVWSSEPENVHCSSATARLRIELRWGCKKSSPGKAVGSGVSFKYDPLGRRIEKVSPTFTSIFAYDGDTLIEETNSSGAVVSRYTQTQNIDEPLAMLRSSTTSYFNADGLGSVTSLTNSSGVAAQTYTYDSFGKVTASSGSVTNPFQYTGREADPETGLYYYRARYFDTSIGKFLNNDPIDFDGGINFYAYVGNNPVRFRDSFGLCDARKKYDACIDSARQKKKHDLLSASVETAGGIALTLTTVYMSSEVILSELEEIHEARNVLANIGLRAMFAFDTIPRIVAFQIPGLGTYAHGVADLTKALNDYDRAVADCDLHSGYQFVH